MKSRILVTGGAGYIGSHTVKKLKKHGFEVVVLDDLSYGRKELVAGTDLIVGDIADTEVLDKIIRDYKPEAVIHFAAFKDAGESVFKPDKYFYNNTAKTIILLNKLLESGVKNVIFSSTAAVYGNVQNYPITEEFPVQPVNPYGVSKAMIEEVLAEYQKAFGLKPIIFRYFNAGGADLEGELGNLYPNPQDIISVIMRAANGELAELELFGTDYDTKDGSTIRDIIHVDDLAEAHVLGLEKLLSEEVTGIFNLGSEEGFSIKEIIESAKKITGKDFKVVESPRRPGDVVVSIASSQKAKEILGWKAKNNIEDIIKTAWEWQNKVKGKDAKVEIGD